MKKLTILMLIALSTMFFWKAQSKAAPNNEQEYFDNSINGIFLNDGESSLAIFGKERLDVIINYLAALPAPPFKYGFYNQSQTELLELIYHPGHSSFDEYAEFRVYEANDSSHEYSWSSSFVKFVSGKGIKIGLNIKEVISILGDSFERKILGDKKILHYGWPKDKSSLFYYNLIFSNEELIEFSFGYEYP